jgi:hypothetical protein
MKKNKQVRVGLLAGLLALSMVFAGCGGSSNGDVTSPDPEPGGAMSGEGLAEAIAAATAAMNGIVIQAEGTIPAEVETGIEYWLQTDVDSLTAAITAAQTVANNTAATQAEIDAAETALNTAVGAFTDAKQAGTQVPGVPVDPGMLGDIAVTLWTNKADTTLTVAGDNGGAVVGGGPYTISGEQTLSATLADDLSLVSWEVGGTVLGGTNGPVEVTANLLGAGSYELVIMATDDAGALYSASIAFTKQ